MVINDQAKGFMLQASCGGYRFAQPALQVAPLLPPAFSSCRWVI
jgi:hypothetical protein